MTPKFKHDCEKCEFVGILEGNDIYICGQETVLIPTIVARYGNDGSEYQSGDGIAIAGRIQMTLVKIGKKDS